MLVELDKLKAQYGEITVIELQPVYKTTFVPASEQSVSDSKEGVIEHEQLVEKVEEVKPGLTFAFKKATLGTLGRVVTLVDDDIIKAMKVAFNDTCVYGDHAQLEKTDADSYFSIGEKLIQSLRKRRSYIKEG